MNRKILFGAMLLVSCLTMQAKIKVPAGGKAISDNLIGIFFEDISSSADGGINADLVQNGSFEYSPAIHDGWGPGTCWKFLRPGHSAGYLEPRMDKPICENNPTYMRIHTERVKKFYDYAGWVGVGMQNEGYNGMSVKAGQKYDFSLFARPVTGNTQLRVVIIEPVKEWGKEGGKILADDTITISSPRGGQVGAWNKYATTLTANADSKTATLQILMLDKAGVTDASKCGALDVDMITLIPQDTYHGHGLRKDLCETLEALHPQFMRFPGGCIVHGGGDGFWDTYRWKTTVGPKEQRKTLKNSWGYGQSMEVGYYEYFQMCEDMKMQPLPILPCGVSCQGVNGGWGMKDQAQEVAPMADMDEWAQDILDLIEWANGDVTTKWGKVRAEAGHPKPFGLKYVGIGNEERISPEFIERFKYIYDKVTKAHPEIIVVGTAGPGSHPGNSDYEAAWKLADEIGLPIIDEHYYEPRNYFLTSRQYDAYPHTSTGSAQVRKTKVYLGEYSAKEDSKHGNQLGDALAEALYLTHIERNGDVVCMTSYAPLFARRDNTKWNPDLIYYDNDSIFLTCSYYVQQMFGESAGEYYYGDCVSLSGDVGQSGLSGQSTVLSTKKGELYVKVVNCSDKAVTAKVDLSRFSFKGNAEKVVLTGDADAENPSLREPQGKLCSGQVNYKQHPVSPQRTKVKVKKHMTIDVPANTFIMYKIK